MDDPAARTTAPGRAVAGGGAVPGGPTGAATRLLVLGSVRIFQPVHGYYLRRELVSWRIDDWANVHPGSIYNALRALTRSGLLEEVATGSAGARPARTSYRLTSSGEEEFGALLRSALRATDEPTAFLTGVNFAFALPRPEVLEAVGAHADGLAAQLESLAAQIAELLADDEVPDMASEVLRITAARTGGELAWATDYLARVRGGAYAFAGEAPDWVPTPAQIADAERARVGIAGLA